MTDNNNFQDELARVIEERKEFIEKKQLPKLKEQYQIMYSSFQAVFNVLMRKGLIHEDPYKYDQKISEVSTPAEGPFLESEKADAISVRLSDYESQLEFLVNYYQFSINFLSLKRIKKLIALTKYIRWSSLSESSTSLNTRVLAELLNKVKQGTDNLSTGIISDSITQLDKSSKQALSILKALTGFHREEYKLTVREEVISQINLDPSVVARKPEEAMKLVKRGFSQRLGDKPFYPELIREIFDEDHSPDSQTLQTSLLKKLAVQSNKPEQEEKEVTFKHHLVEAMRVLASATYQIDDAVKKLTDNSNLLSSRKKSFGEMLKNWIIKMVQGENTKLIYEVEFFDITTSATKTEKLNFYQFIEEAEKKAKLLSGFNNKMSPAFKKLSNAKEDQLFDFLNQNLEEVQLLHRRMAALDTFFKSEIPREQRNKLRGIKLELNAIKNSMTKANQKKHEYVAEKEEFEQMKKLGIKTNPS
ncbi:MAG: hypothetical protein ACLFR1_02265 [Spirochaetia bacterium]